MGILRSSKSKDKLHCFSFELFELEMVLKHLREDIQQVITYMKLCVYEFIYIYMYVVRRIDTLEKQN